MEDWSNIAYLQSGTPRQQDAYRVLLESDAFMVLASYDAVLVGSTPLGLDAMLNELEIICHAPDLTSVGQELRHFFGDANAFELRLTEDASPPTLLCRFAWKNFTLEIRVQTVPVSEQVPMRLLDVEARLLRQATQDARRGIQARLDAGQSLHTAFADYFQLHTAGLDARHGDDIAALLALETATYSDIEAVVVTAAHNREPYLLAR